MAAMNRSCVPYNHGCTCEGSAGYDVSGHRLLGCQSSCCQPIQKIPVGNPILIAPRDHPCAQCSCLPEPIVPLVPNVINFDPKLLPKFNGRVPDFYPPSPPCIPVSPMRMAAMPLNNNTGGDPIYQPGPYNGYSLY